MTQFRLLLAILAYLLTRSTSAQDQQYTYGSLLGGSGDEILRGIYTSNDQKSLIFGATSSSDLNVSNPLQPSLAGQFDGVLCELGESGSIEFLSYFGGSGTDVVEDAVKLSNGNIVVVGKTFSNDFPVSGDSFQSIYGGNEDGFIALIDLDYNVLWSTYFGGVGVDRLLGVSFDEFGNIYCSGLSSSPDLGTFGTHQPILGSSSAGIVIKFNANGQRLWTTYFYGNFPAGFSKLEYNATTSNVAVIGSTAATEGITQNGHQTEFGGDFDGILCSFNTSDGSLVWSTYFGGSAGDEIRDIATDTFGNIYICGFTDSSNNMVTPDSFQTLNNGLGDGFFASFSSAGVLNWGSCIGGSDSDRILSIEVTDGQISLLGATKSLTDIAFGNPLEPINQSPPVQISDRSVNFLASFDTSGAVIWSSYFLSGCTSAGASSHSKVDGTIRMCGEINPPYISCEPIITADATQNVFGGGEADGAIFFVEDLILGHSERIHSPKFRTYPNPVRSKFWIEFENQSLLLKRAELYSLNGTLVRTFTNNLDSGLLISDIEAGLYILRITLDDASVSQTKLVIF